MEVTLRLAVYRQSVRLGVKPLEDHDQSFFPQLNSCCNGPYRNILSDERLGLSFTIAAGPRQHILRSDSRGTHGHILLSQIRDSPIWRARSRCCTLACLHSRYLAMVLHATVCCIVAFEALRETALCVACRGSQHSLYTVHQIHA
jgi:hypothetical protein